MMQQFKYLANTAIPYSKRTNTSGWYVVCILLINSFRLMMEKYDGVRVYWDGSRLHSKHPSVVLDIPKRLNFPNIPFEGELWYFIVYIPLNVDRMGSNNYVQCINFLKNAERDWTNAKIIVFDAPQATDIPYSQRLNMLHQSTYNLFPIMQKMQ